MRVTIELTDDDRISIDRGARDSESGHTGNTDRVVTKEASGRSAPEAVDGGSPSEELLAALGAGAIEHDGEMGGEVPQDAGYEQADGTSAGAPPDWLADLLGGKTLS